MSMPTDNGRDYFVKDFYERTLKLLDSTQSEYDVALLINLMIGLLVVPKERYFHSIKVEDKFVDKELLKRISSAYVDEPDLDLKEIIRRLRNSVCHGNMEIKAEKPNYMGEQMKIGSIVFKDKSGYSAEISIDLLKRFLINFATNVVSMTKERR